MTEETRAPREKKVNPSVILKAKLAELMSTENEKDLRFMYFDAPKGYIVTAATKLMRDENYLIISFSFCSPKDTFCKASGKIKCIERIRAYEELAAGKVVDGPNAIAELARYIITMPFAYVPKIMSVGMAYNMLPSKPMRLAASKFNFDLCSCIVE